LVFDVSQFGFRLPTVGTNEDDVNEASEVVQSLISLREHALKKNEGDRQVTSRHTDV
jgi:hypothetical protein